MATLQCRTATALRQRPALVEKPRVRKVRSEEVLGYPVFGYRTKTLRILNSKYLSEVERYACKMMLGGYSDDFLFREIVEKQRLTPRWYNHYWVVELRKQQHQLPPGEYIFSVIQNFVRIPGQPQNCGYNVWSHAIADQAKNPLSAKDLMWEKIRTVWSQAMLEERYAPISYMDLMWEDREEGKAMLHPDRLLEMETQQVRATLAQVRRWLWLYRLVDKLEDAARLREQNISEKLAKSGYVLRHRLGEKPTLKAMVRTLLMPEPMLAVERLDPAIVIEYPHFANATAGPTPLGLIAHWD